MLMLHSGWICRNKLIAPDGVHIAGNFQGWDPAATAMTPFIGDVFTYTYTGTAGEYIEYKYVNGEWDGDKMKQSLACCTQNGNRYLTLEEDIILETVCFESCYPCNFGGTPRDITFRVDLSDATYTTGAYIAGTMQDPPWTQELMTDMGNDIFEITFTLEESDCHEYKFLADESGWENFSGECIAFSTNRFLEVPNYNQVLDLVCYSSCDPCSGVNVKFQVDMSEQTVSELVYVTGTFNGWNNIANPLTDLGTGIWETTLVLQTGQPIEYKFINGPSWDGAEVVPDACAWGEFKNRYFEVPTTNTDLDLVCFSACNPCTPTNLVDVTFQVDMSQEIVSGDVFLAGDFNDWTSDATPMTDMGSNIYEVILSLGEDFVYGYKFINGDIWEEYIMGDCAYNGGRKILVPPVPPLDPVCFNSCDLCPDPYVFNIKVILEGPFNGTDMNTDLYDAGLVPVNQPYNVEPWNYDGIEMITAGPDADIVDWVYIEFRETDGDASTATSEKFLDHQAAVLLSDGSIATPDGNPHFYYTGDITEDLYIFIYHRNHLAVMSAIPLVDLFGTYAYDFTTDVSLAYMDGQKLLGGGVYCGMIGGDSDGNGDVDTNDKDVNWTNDAGIAGYHGSDLNMDTQVNNQDKDDIWLPNDGEGTQIPN